MAKTDQDIAVHEEEVSIEAASAKPDHNIAAAIWTIVCGVALPCIPVLVVTAVLLYIVFHYQVIVRPGWPELQLHVNHTQFHESTIQKLSDVRHHGGRPAYYVRYNPSTITTIAAWTGRVIPYLSSSIMALVAFFAARRIVTNSKRGDGSDLPTPEQLTLLIGLLGGSGMAPLKDTMLHRWAKRERLVDPIPFAFYALLLLTCVGLIIPMVDTWFGIATTPDFVTQLYNTTSASYHSFGRDLLQNVTLWNNVSTARCPGSFRGFTGLEWLPCNLDFSDQNAYGIDPWLIGAPEATAISQGMSDTNVVMNHTLADGSLAYFLADKAIDSKVDFKAKTYAVATHCTPITRRCMPGQTDQNPVPSDWNYNQYNFTCSPGFKANFTFNGAAQMIDAAPQDGGSNQNVNVPHVGLAFAPDANFTSRVGVAVPNLETKIFSDIFHNDSSKALPEHYIGTNWSYSYVLPRNPLHFVAWSSGFPTTSLYDQRPLLRDPDIFTDGLFTYWILGCGATVYEVQYTWVNGSIHTFNATPSSPEMGGLVSGPFAFQLSQAPMALSDAANLASVQNASQDLADVFARGWSKAAVAMAVGSQEASLNEIEQIRNSTVGVARVPLIPLYLLLGFKALYVIVVILLAIGAYCFTHPAETEVVKAQLSAKGLAAAHFESPGLLQHNVVQEIQRRLQPKTKAAEAEGNVVAERESTESLSRSDTTASKTDPARKVGLVAHADGAWRFAVVADGVWKSIKPVAVNIIDLEAKKGGLGTAGEVIAAWAR